MGNGLKAVYGKSNRRGYERYLSCYRRDLNAICFMDNEESWKVSE